MVVEKKIVHLCLDEKFIDMAISTFNSFENVINDPIVYSRNRKLKFVKNKALIIKNPNTLGTYINSYNLIIVHSLAPIWSKLLLKVDKNIPIIWIGWGYDYYDIIGKDLYLSETKNLINNVKYLSLSELIKIKLIDFARKIWRIRLSADQKKIIERVDYFSPVLETEYEMVKRKFSGNKFPKYITFNYGNLEDFFAKNLEGERVKSKNILVGNSASFTNNHLEAFNLLKEINNFDSKIICPLSYGDEKYRRYIENKGIEYFGEKFISLKDFMPLAEYIQTISSCGYVIMNHCRQQAYGNIVTMLYLGAKVFLREENPLYIYLKNKGVYIFSIQELENNKNFGEILDESKVLTNRYILKLLLSKKVIDDHVRKILEISKNIDI